MSLEVPVLVLALAGLVALIVVIIAYQAGYGSGRHDLYTAMYEYLKYLVARTEAEKASAPPDATISVKTLKMLDSAVADFHAKLRATGL